MKELIKQREKGRGEQSNKWPSFKISVLAQHCKVTPECHLKCNNNKHKLQWGWQVFGFQILFNQVTGLGDQE